MRCASPLVSVPLSTTTLVWAGLVTAPVDACALVACLACDDVACLEPAARAGELEALLELPEPPPAARTAMSAIAAPTRKIATSAAGSFDERRDSRRRRRRRAAMASACPRASDEGTPAMPIAAPSSVAEEGMRRRGGDTGAGGSGGRAGASDAGDPEAGACVAGEAGAAAGAGLAAAG